MAISLDKGVKVNLNKESEAVTGSPTIKVGKFGLGWDVNPSSYGSNVQEFDMDRFALILNADGKPAFGDLSLIFYGNPKDPSGAVEMSPDNTTGVGAGYDEVGTINFEKLTPEVYEILVCVSIYEFAKRKQNFGQIKNAKIDVINADNDTILTHTDLEEDMSMGTGAIIGRFRREADGTWSFKALADLVKGGMPEILTKYGINFTN